MQTVKRHFFAMRNGIISDTLRKSGSPFKIIFGLNLPQIVEIADATEHTAELADRLWANNTTRESMLLAPMIYPRAQFNRDTALRWIAMIPTPEIADILCHRLLRHKDFAADLAAELVSSAKEMDRYTGLRLFFNLVASRPAEALAAAEQELKSPAPLTARIAAMLADEARFLLQN